MLTVQIRPELFCRGDATFGRHPLLRTMVFVGSNPILGTRITGSTYSAAIYLRDQTESGSLWLGRQLADHSRLEREMIVGSSPTLATDYGLVDQLAGVVSFKN